MFRFIRSGLPAVALALVAIPSAQAGHCTCHHQQPGHVVPMPMVTPAPIGAPQANGRIQYQSTYQPAETAPAVTPAYAPSVPAPRNSGPMRYAPHAERNSIEAWRRSFGKPF